MHGILKRDFRTVMHGIVNELGSCLAACGDVNRNVMAPPAPFEKGGYPAARQLADEIADLLSPEAAEGSYLDLWVDGDLSYRFAKLARIEFSANCFRSCEVSPIPASRAAKLSST